MKKNKKIWAYALAGALAFSNLSVVVAPFGSIIAQAADGDLTIHSKIVNNGDEDTSSPGALSAAVGTDYEVELRVYEEKSSSNAKKSELVGTGSVGRAIVSSESNNDLPVALSVESVTKAGDETTGYYSVKLKIDGTKSAKRTAASTDTLTLATGKTFVVTYTEATAATVATSNYLGAVWDSETEGSKSHDFYTSGTTAKNIVMKRNLNGEIRTLPGTIGTSGGNYYFEATSSNKDVAILMLIR